MKFIPSVLFLVASVQAAPKNCSAQYQAALQQVLNIKERCSEVAYKDCCEVNYKLYTTFLCAINSYSSMHAPWVNT